jgi:RHS repeat-associated protein
MEWDECGNYLLDTNPGFQPFGFAGSLYDPDLNLHHFGAREYDPTVGRWLQPDPLGLEGGLNLYAYCGNDPINAIDPTGLAAKRKGFWGDLADIAGAFLSGCKEGAAATADGFIPFWDPFKDVYTDANGNHIDGTDISLFCGGMSRDLLLSTAIPNVGVWAKNPAMYELGQTTLSATEFAELGELTAIERGAILWERYGLRGFLPSLSALGQYRYTIGTGLTPGGYLFVIATVHAADYVYEKWGK